MVKKTIKKNMKLKHKKRLSKKYVKFNYKKTISKKYNKKNKTNKRTRKNRNLNGGDIPGELTETMNQNVKDTPAYKSFEKIVTNFSSNARTGFNEFISKLKPKTNVNSLVNNI